MDDTEKLATFGLEPEWMAALDIRGGASAGKPLAKAVWSGAVAVIDDLDTKFRTPDKDLSPEGRRKSLARVAADARTRLRKLEGRRDKLIGDANTLRAALAKNDADTTVLASIWPRLPTNALELQIMHGDAVARGDGYTAQAIESLPLAFGNHFAADDVAALRRTRIEAEDPEGFERLVHAEEAVDAASRALQGANSHLAELAKGLPDPEPEDGATNGSDGLRVLSPSQAEEAKDGQNAPREVVVDGLRMVGS